MGAKQKWDDPARPPRHGPLAEALFIDGRWRLRLLETGKQVIEAHLRKFPQPENILFRFAPGLMRRIGLDYDKESAARLVVRSAAMEGLVEAACLYDPESSSGASFVTYSSYYVWKVVGYTTRKKKHEPAVVGSLSLSADIRDRDCSSGSQEFFDQEELSFLDGVLDRYIHNPRNRQIFKLRVLDGWTLKELAEEFGISREMARQITDKVGRRIRSRIATAYGVNDICTDEKRKIGSRLLATCYIRRKKVAS